MESWQRCGLEEQGKATSESSQQVRKIWKAKSHLHLECDTDHLMWCTPRPISSCTIQGRNQRCLHHTELPSGVAIYGEPLPQIHKSSQSVLHAQREKLNRKANRFLVIYTDSIRKSAIIRTRWRHSRTSEWRFKKVLVYHMWANIITLSAYRHEICKPDNMACLRPC